MIPQRTQPIRIVVVVMYWEFDVSHERQEPWDAIKAKDA